MQVCSGEKKNKPTLNKITVELHTKLYIQKGKWVFLCMMSDFLIKFVIKQTMLINFQGILIFI